MLEIRRDADIHREQGGWFDARWHFSFDQYRDPAQMGIGPLRVFNDDRLVAGADWPMHPHADVEGLTYVVEGTFEHADSLGNGGQLQPGGVQRMTLGSGALHSERNGSDTEPMRFLQFWILPDEANLEPSIEQRQFTKEDRNGQLLRVIGGDPPAVAVHQDAAAYVASLAPGDEVLHDLDDDRGGLPVPDRGRPASERRRGARDRRRREGVRPRDARDARDRRERADLGGGARGLHARRRVGGDQMIDRA